MLGLAGGQHKHRESKVGGDRLFKSISYLKQKDLCLQQTRGHTADTRDISYIRWRIQADIKNGTLFGTLL